MSKGPHTFHITPFFFFLTFNPFNSYPHIVNSHCHLLYITKTVYLCHSISLHLTLCLTLSFFENCVRDSLQANC